MTSSGPEEPSRASEYPSLENSGSQPDPFAPVDYPAPGYYTGAGYDPYRPMKPPGTNGKAIAALITSLVGLFCCGLPSIAGLVLGVIGMRETKRTGQDGYAIALIGAIIG